MAKKVFFIAEAGKNFIVHNFHNGAKDNRHYQAMARELISAANKAGADAVKFQAHVFDDERPMRSKKRWEWIRFNEEITPIEFWQNIKAHCDRIGIELIITPMSKKAAEKVDMLVGRWKVGSGNVTDKPLLEYIKSTGKPVILSTGMSTQEQVMQAIGIVGRENLSLLYCKSIYPCPPEKISWTRMREFKNVFGVRTVGFSDHTTQITTPMRAVISGGAEIIEKHFTLKKSHYGPDHAFSLEPRELATAIKLTRAYEGKDKTQQVMWPEEEEVRLWEAFRL